MKSQTYLSRTGLAKRLNGEFRQITPRALARFQSFPDDFLLPDNNALAGKIVGNAVPPDLIKSLVETFAD